jgi:transcriptional regulator with XRE-family HTH domain
MTERDEAIDRFYRDVGNLVQAARDQAGLSQTELADRIGFTRSSVANLEAGRQRIRLHILALIADALRVNTDELVPKARLGIAKDFSQVDLTGHEASTRRFVESAISQIGKDQ